MPVHIPAHYHLDPSVSAVIDPETVNASPSSPTSSPPMQPFPSPSPHDHPENLPVDQDLDSVPDLPNSRKTRELASSYSTAQPQSPGLQQIRRKPLSSAASSTATRYSSAEYLSIARDLPMPEHRFSRSFSVDSPTVYEFPHSSLAPRIRSNSATKPQTFTTNKE